MRTKNGADVIFAKNRNGPDGLVFPIFMDTGNVKIKVLSQSTETATEIIEKATKKQEANLKEKYKNYKKDKKG
jgi:hypothetical protein